MRKWIWFVAMCYFMAGSALASPYISISDYSYDPEANTITIRGNMSWTFQSQQSNNPQADPMEIGLALFLGRIGTPEVYTGKLSVTCPRPENNEYWAYWAYCQKAWTKKYGSSANFTIKEHVPSPSQATDYCVSLGTRNSRVAESNCAGRPGPPPKLTCKVASGLSPVFNYGSILAEKVNGSKRNQRIDVTCSYDGRPADADFSVKMTKWQLDLNNGSVAEFTLSANGNTLSRDGHLSKTKNGALSIDLDTTLKGKPTKYGDFSASTVLTLIYE